MERTLRIGHVDMSNAERHRPLITAGIDGISDSFKAASEAVIREERKKKRRLFANGLERLLYGERANWGRDRLHVLPAAKLPINKVRAPALVEDRPAVQDETDIVLGDAAKSAPDEVAAAFRQDCEAGIPEREANRWLSGEARGAGALQVSRGTFQRQRRQLYLVLIRRDKIGRAHV